MKTPSEHRQFGGVSVGVVISVLVGLLVAVVGGAGFIAWYMHSERLKADQQAEAAAKAKTQAELALAKTHQDQALAEIRATTNVLERLLAAVTDIATASEILTNSDGKLAAQYPTLVGSARHLFDADVKTVVDRDRVITRLEGIRRLQQQLITASGSAYEPAVDLLVTTKEASSWADERLQVATQVRDRIATLAREARIKVGSKTVTADSPTLERAISDLTEKENKAAEQLVATQTALAKAEAAKVKAEAEAEAIRAEASRSAKRIEADQQTKNAATERELAERAAQNKLAAAQSSVKVATAEEEAAKVQLRKKAADPTVLSKLAPFLTPGRQQMNTMTAQPAPFSYQELVSVRALEQSMNGYKQLLTIAWRPDRERPRWTMNPTLFHKHPNEVNQIAEAQSLLIELGPVLVEMGKLRP